VAAAAARYFSPVDSQTWFIAVDDLNDWVGCLGVSRREDAHWTLAAGGVLFSNALPGSAPQPLAPLAAAVRPLLRLYTSEQDWRETGGSEKPRCRNIPVTAIGR
jgi:hypothetical protein